MTRQSWFGSTDKINRLISLSPKSRKTTKYGIQLAYNTPDIDYHGELKSIRLVVHTKAGKGTHTLIVRFGDLKFKQRLEQSEGTITTVTLGNSTDLKFGDKVKISLSVETTRTTNTGVIITITKPINNILNLKQIPSLLLLVKNNHIYHESAKQARSDFLNRYGATSHHLGKRATKQHFSFCRRHNLIINFSDIGYDFIIAPIQFNAYTCSGQCHMDHKETPMTYHAFFQTVLHYKGSKFATRAVCVSETMSSMTLLVKSKDDFYMTKYPGMRAESCGCR